MRDEGSGPSVGRWSFVVGRIKRRREKSGRHPTWYVRRLAQERSGVLSAGRASSIGAILIIPLLLWAWLSSARNDLITTTRSLVKQIKVDQGSMEREEAALARLFIRLRLPDGNPDSQEQMFGRLWFEVKRLEPTTFEYGESGRKKADDGNSHSYREVVVRGTGPEAEPRTLRLEWMQNRGNWYIYDYKTEGAGR
jgi:hypothetical protein